jgi:hypothetical protein
MNKIVALAARTSVVLAGAVISAPAAQAADTRPCVTRAEYRAVNRGMRKPTVTRIWDGRGQVAEGGRYYRACGGGFVGVNYSVTAHPRVLSKYRAAS